MLIAFLRDIRDIPCLERWKVVISDDEEQKDDGYVYVNVPFKDKDKAKLYGCRWDSQEKRWYFINTEHYQRMYGKFPSSWIC